MGLYKQGAFGVRDGFTGFWVTKDGQDISGPMTYDTATMLVSRKYRAAKEAAKRAAKKEAAEAAKGDAVDCYTAWVPSEERAREAAAAKAATAELAARIKMNLDIPALKATIRERGQAYIGTEDAFLASYEVTQEELTEALEAMADDLGMGAVIGGMDGNWPGDWFLVGIELEAEDAPYWAVAEELAVRDVQGAIAQAEADRAAKVEEVRAWTAGRLEALMILPLDDLKALAISLGVAEAELTSRYAAAREIIWAEDQYPIWRWFDPIEVAIVLADRPPCRDGIIQDVIAYKAGRLGHAWGMAKQAAQASTNVRVWRALGPCGFRMIGFTDAECEAALGRELDEAPF